jgi:hypothetical protein
MSQIYFNSPVNDQIENFQTTLASLNQKVISLQESVQEKDAEIAKLQGNTLQVGPDSWRVRSDETLTIVGALIKLYQYIFLSGKAP